MLFDVLIIGGGPAGLSAALCLGRARRQVLLCDAGPRRNAAAEHMHNFVTRDGTPPEDFRRLGREQLKPYPGVEVRDVQVQAIRGERGAFEVLLETGEQVMARRILLCTGLIDVLPEIEGFRTHWGRSIFLCPYCHGWEVQDRAFGFFAPAAEMLEFAVFFRGWTHDLVALTDGRYGVPEEVQKRLEGAGVRIEQRRITQLIGTEGQLEQVAFDQGNPIRLEVIFTRVPQRQVAIVESLGLVLDAGGYVQLDAQRQTSVPGIYAGGDLTTPMQAAIMAASSGVQAAAMLNHELTVELALSGALR